MLAMDADDRYLAENEDRKDIYNNVSFSSRAHSNESKTRYYNSRTEEETCSTEASVSPWAKPGAERSSTSELSTRMMVPETSFPSAYLVKNKH